MRAPQFPASFFKTNRENLLAKLPDGALAVVWANRTFIHNGDSVYPYKQNSSFFYLTGLMEESAVLILLRRSAGDCEELLCVREADELERVWLGKTLTFEDVSEISGVKGVRSLESFEGEYHRRALGVESLYFLLEEHPRSDGLSHFYSYNHKKFLELKEKYPLHRHERLAPLVNSLRRVKSSEELAYIEEAIRITLAGYRAILPLLRKGNVREYVLEAELSREFLRCGSEGFSFSPIIAGGERSCTLHYTENSHELINGSHVLIDVGASYGNYHGDLTRVFPVGVEGKVLGKYHSSEQGKFSRRFRAIYDAVVRVHDTVLEFIRPGVTFKEYDLKVRETMMNELRHLALVTEADVKIQEQQYREHFMHGISHFLGLDVHDVGERDGVFLENMVLTLEPGIYVRQEGLGVRLENDILITENGARNLSEDFPIERERVEALMVES